MRALVIDDSRTVRMILSKMLRELDMDVLEASNGIEALAQIERHPDIGLMLVDWNMPEMNGYDLVCAVRAQPALEAVPILMVTSEAQGAQVSQALHAGANEYLMKPFNKDGLITKLQLLGALKE
jgi:two-component system chemotaxis response regulator CheY